MCNIADLDAALRAGRTQPYSSRLTGPPKCANNSGHIQPHLDEIQELNPGLALHPQAVRRKQSLRQHLNHDECVRRGVHGCQAQSQHLRGAAGFLPETVQIAKGRVVAALAKTGFRLMDYFGLGSKIQISRNSMIRLVAGGGFEPPTFGL